MKKILKGFMIVLLSISSFIMGSVVVFGGQETISPYYTNCNTCVCTFAIDDPGEAHITIAYNGKSESFSEARATVKIQKRFLGIFWKTVDIGMTNNEWTATSTDINGRFYNYFSLDGTGTYRAIFTVEIIGIDGSVDLIEDTIESKYS